MPPPSIIKIRVRTDRNGIVTQLVSTGHAPLESQAFSPACAAVSSALRSFARLVIETSGIELCGHAAHAGSLELKFGKTSKEVRPWLRGACDLLLRELNDAASEADGLIEIEQTVEKQG